MALLGLLVVVWAIAIIWGAPTDPLDADAASPDPTKERPPQPRRIDSFDSEKRA